VESAALRAWEPLRADPPAGVERGEECPTGISGPAAVRRVRWDLGPRWDGGETATRWCAFRICRQPPPTCTDGASLSLEEHGFVPQLPVRAVRVRGRGW